MSTFASMGTSFASSPQQAARSSSSPDPTHVEHQLVVGMNAPKSHDGDCQGAYVSSPWSGCLGSQTSSDELEHYALHSSPALSSLAQTSSGQSSPRTWDSPEQLGLTPWEAATEQLQGRYHGLDPQLSGYSIPTPFAADASFLPGQGFNGQDGCQRARSQTEPYPASYHTSPRDGYPATPESSHPLSPCSTTLRLSVEDGAPGSPGDDVRSQADTLVGMESPDAQVRKKSPSVGQMQADGSKPEEPYAQLIYKAFLSTPRRAMTLQEIYQWFRENTDKGKSDSKGWQNSIRHNLSMNHAFTKRERRLSASKDGQSTGTSSQTEGKKSTEWFLEPWAITGVQSTTRYRKGNQSRRNAASHGGLSARVYRSYPAQHHHHHSFSSKKNQRRALRGTRALPLRSTSVPMRHHHRAYPFPATQHHRSPYTSHGVHHLMNPASPSPYAASFFTTHHTTTSPTATTGMEYDYPDPQLFPTVTSSDARGPSSEPGAGDDEPVTPEPLHAAPYQHHGDGQAQTQGQYYYQAQHAYLQNQVVGVYDEGMDAAVEGFPGWGAAVTGVAGVAGVGMQVSHDMDGMGVQVCAEQNGFHQHAGY